MTDSTISSIEELRAVVGEPTAGLELKIYDELFDEACEFIARSPFLVLSTSDHAGNQDASPKGDAPGFVVVEDSKTLLIPDRPGNRLVYGHTNILEQPKVGILFVIPGTTETLRVNGRASLHADVELLDRLAARGRPAILAIRVQVDQCFFHCSKAFIRSALWKSETWPEKRTLSFGAMFARRLGTKDPAVARTIDDAVAEDYRTNL